MNEVISSRESHDSSSANESNDASGTTGTVSDASYLEMIDEIIGQSKGDFESVPPIPSGTPSSQKSSSNFMIPPIPATKSDSDAKASVSEDTDSPRNKLDDYLAVLDQMMSQRDDSKKSTITITSTSTPTPKSATPPPNKSTTPVKSSTATPSPKSTTPPPTKTVPVKGAVPTKSTPTKSSTPPSSTSTNKTVATQAVDKKTSSPSIPSNNNNRASVQNPYTSKLDQLLNDFDSFAQQPKSETEGGDLFDYSWEFSYKKELSKELDELIVNKGKPVARNNKTILGNGFYGVSYKVIWREQEVSAKHLSIITFSSFQKDMKSLVYDYLCFI